MSAALLQSNHANGTTITSLPCTFSSAVTPGSLLICYAQSTASTRTFTASDGPNGAYNNDIANNGGSGSTAILSFPNTASGTPTITLVMSGANGSMAMIIEEWSGVQVTTPKDQTATGTTPTNTTSTSGTTASLSQANELCVAMGGLNSNAGATFAVQGPWTPSPSSPWPSGVSSTVAAGYLLPGASTSGVTATFNWSNTQSFRGCTATYKTVQLGQIAPFYNRKNILYFI